jgi:DNA-binding response OmpR family regulator
MMKQVNTPCNYEKKVLVVDDNVSITQLLKTTLEESGKFRVRIVNSALSAIATAREFKPDLILLNIIMPDMDGHRGFLNTKIIFFSELLTKKETGTTGKIIGGNMCIAKSAIANNVVNCVDNILGEKVVAH